MQFEIENQTKLKRIAKKRKIFERKNDTNFTLNEIPFMALAIHNRNVRRYEWENHPWKELQTRNIAAKPKRLAETSQPKKRWTI